MDSLTQAALGATIGELVLGRRIAGKAALYGAVVATIPDLDVFVPMGGPVADFVYHRSWSHSLLVLTAISPLVAEGIRRWRGDPESWRIRWLTLVFLALFTHPLLDAFTIYGTQLLWPLSDYPFGIGSVFIIDPAFTLPLLIGLLLAMTLLRHSPHRTRAAAIGLAVGCTYLGWTVFAQHRAAAIVATADNHPYGGAGLSLTIPSPFNSLLWRSIIMAPNGRSYAIGYDSFLDGRRTPTFETYRTRADLLEALAGHWPADRLRAFTKGFNGVSEVSGRVSLRDLRMGVEGRYVFAFEIARMANGAPVPLPAMRIPPTRDLSGLGRVFERILDPNVKLAPPSQR
ncbi:MAG: metal-dependent hydrolase [Pseudomonadota bacterium]